MEPKVTSKLSYIKGLAAANGIDRSRSLKKMEGTLIEMGVLQSFSERLPKLKIGDNLLWLGGVIKRWWDDGSDRVVPTPMYVQFGWHKEGSNKIGIYIFGSSRCWSTCTTEVSSDTLLIDRKCLAMDAERCVKDWRHEVDDENKDLFSKLEKLSSEGAMVSLFLTGSLDEKMPEYEYNTLGKAREKKNKFSVCNWDIAYADMDTVSIFRLMPEMYRYSGSLSVLIQRTMRRIVNDAKKTPRYNPDVERSIKNKLLKSFFSVVMEDVECYREGKPAATDLQEVMLDAASTIVYSHLCSLEKKENYERRMRDIDERITEMGESIDNIAANMVVKARCYTGLSLYGGISDKEWSDMQNNDYDRMGGYQHSSGAGRTSYGGEPWYAR